MDDPYFLGIDCGSVSLNLALFSGNSTDPFTLYLRTGGRPLETLIRSLDELREVLGTGARLSGAFVTGSGRELFARCLHIPAINEISAHAAGAWLVNPAIRTIIEIGGQDSKFIRMEQPRDGEAPRIASFRMNEICAAGTGAFLDEQADRLGIPVESFGPLALTSTRPASIAGRCAVFAKTDMIHQAQEGRPLTDILLGVAFALARNYIATLIRGDALVPMVSFQGGVMENSAVVRAFEELLGLSPDQITIPPYFKVLGAVGCADMARRSPLSGSLSLSDLRERAAAASGPAAAKRFAVALQEKPLAAQACQAPAVGAVQLEPPLIMGLDLGSVSAKGVVIDSRGTIVTEHYRLSFGRPLEALDRVVSSLSEQAPFVSAVAITGSGRVLAGRLLDADLTVNEITAQARAARHHDPDVDTIIEIGGQDSKLIVLEHGTLKDFEMNRVCAAGTGSFLMEQADRLRLDMESEFAKSAFSSASPADLGTRCTVFMESDLIHHQNNGTSREDLAAGVCISIVKNYLERVAGTKPLGSRILFLGGVAANPAVKSAFEHETGLSLESPGFFRVSGAFGAALSALDAWKSGELVMHERPTHGTRISQPEREGFSCAGCANQCRIDSYRLPNLTVYHGGKCDRWEVDAKKGPADHQVDPFRTRMDLLESIAYPKTSERGGPDSDRGGLDSRRRILGMPRSPLAYEWFPFWHRFWKTLGVELKLATRPDRHQFEQGTKFLRVETCLPMKAMAGQVWALTQEGVNTIFQPAMLTENPADPGGRPLEHCPYIQVSSQFVRGSFDVDWLEPVIRCSLDPESLRDEHLRMARSLGFSQRLALEAFEKGISSQAHFEESIQRQGHIFLRELGETEKALVILGKPYHTAEPFLNMNLGSLCRRLGIKAIPADLFPIDHYPSRSPVPWKHQLRMIGVVRAIAGDPRLFPVMVSFFGCGPDPFTIRHIREGLKGKPLLILEMDEHTSRAGVMTRLEAFLDRVRRSAGGDLSQYEARHAGHRVALRPRTTLPAPLVAPEEDGVAHGPSAVEPERPPERQGRQRRVDCMYLPYFGDHSYAFAAAVRSVGVEAHVLPSPDEESARLARPHLMGGECHPYSLILGDYLKLAMSLAPEPGKRSLFCVPGYSACRLGQYPVYIEKVRKECGFPMRVIADLGQALTAFGLSKKNRELVRLRTWEGLNAYDVLLQVFWRIRPMAGSPQLVDAVHAISRESLFQCLSRGQAEMGIRDALQRFSEVKTGGTSEKPAVAVTGDYYTRIVAFANNEVHREIEDLGAVLWAPPTFSDGLKLHYLQEALGNGFLTGSPDFASVATFYASMVLSELRIKGSVQARAMLAGDLDPLGARTRKSTTRHMDPRYPPGMAAPLATALGQIQGGADGVLNLITLNCSYGTVVTAALGRAMKEHPGVPMLTLVYDGLKKTNEKTRLEAFMDQVHARFKSKKTAKNEPCLP